MSKRIEVSVVAFQQGALWVAQCVEYDIAAFAKTLPELPRALERAVAANLCANADLGREVLDGVPPAPERFRQMFESSSFDLRPTAKAPQARKQPVRIRDLRVAEAA